VISSVDRPLGKRLRHPQSPMIIPLILGALPDFRDNLLIIRKRCSTEHPISHHTPALLLVSGQCTPEASTGLSPWLPCRIQVAIIIIVTCMIQGR
jgi:hypothetical protein